MGGFTIGDRSVGPGESTFVIAEAGSNHNGDLDIAKELIDVAADAGVDAVKFQIFRAEKLYADDTEATDSAFETVSEYEVPYSWLPELADRCDERGVQFLATPFDELSVDALVDYVPAFKIASFSLTHYPMLRAVADTDLPMLVSTGAHDRRDIERTASLLDETTSEGLALLHCVSSYPTPISESNVRAVRTLSEEFDVVSGLSDHTTDPTIAPTAAVAVGASIVEKHFTLDSSMQGPDHEFALEPEELEEMVDSIRKTEQVLGKGSLSPRPVEEGSASRARRGIFAARRIEAGDKVDDGAVQLLRPGRRDGNGLHPVHLDTILGGTVTETVEAGEAITEQHVNVEIGSPRDI